jgi:hypothetical protein
VTSTSVRIASYRIEQRIDDLARAAKCHHGIGSDDSGCRRRMIRRSIPVPDKSERPDRAGSSLPLGVNAWCRGCFDTGRRRRFPTLRAMTGYSTRSGHLRRERELGLGLARCRTLIDGRPRAARLMQTEKVELPTGWLERNTRHTHEFRAKEEGSGVDVEQ